MERRNTSLHFPKLKLVIKLFFFNELALTNWALNHALLAGSGGLGAPPLYTLIQPPQSLKGLY